MRAYCMSSGREGGIHYKSSLFAWDSLENGQAKDGGELDQLFGRLTAST